MTINTSYLETSQKARIDELLEKDYTITPIPVADQMGLTVFQCTPPERGRRFYIVPGIENPLPSVTTIVDSTLKNPALDGWKTATVAKQLQKKVGAFLLEDDIDFVVGETTRVAEESMEIGNTMHHIIDCLLNGEEVAIPEYYEPAVAGWFRWRNHYSNYEWLGSEVAIYDPAGGYAGTVDALFRDTETEGLVICDWKTSGGIYVSHLLQLSAYATAFDEMSLEYRVGEVPTQAMVVRLMTDYPKLSIERVSKKTGKPYKTKVRVPDSKKYFTGKVQSMLIDRTIYDPAFEHLQNLYNSLPTDTVVRQQLREQAQVF